MKKAISLMLAFVLCLSMCACGKSEAVTNVETLIKVIGEVSTASGEAITAAEAAYNALTDEEKEQVSGIDTLSAAKVDYVEALIASIGEVTLDSEPAILTAEEAYNALSDEEKAGIANYPELCDARVSLDETLFVHSILGKWVCTDCSSYLILEEDRTATFYDGYTVYSITYEVIDETIELSINGLQLDCNIVVDENGITHLQNIAFDGVREADLEAFTPEAVEITLDNWDTYFDIREIVALIKNEFGEYTDVDITSGIFLKDEYLDALSEQVGLYPSEVTFEVQYDLVYKSIEIDKVTGEYSLSEKNYAPEFSGRETNISTTYDFRTFSSGDSYAAPSTEGSEEYVQNDTAENLVAQIYGISYVHESGIKAHSYGMNFEVLRVKGTIYLNN